MSEQLENTIVLAGDAQDEELLIEENIDDTDVFAAVTNSEEANVLSAMLAKRLGARKVLALVNRPTYGDLMENRSVDIAVSPQTVTIGSLLAHVRKGDVVRVHSLRRGSAEALETVVHGTAERSRAVGRSVGEIDMPNGASIVALVRGEKVVIAHHDTRIETEDHVIVFLADRRQIDAVQRLFHSEPASHALAAGDRQCPGPAAGAVRVILPAADRHRAHLWRDGGLAPCSSQCAGVTLALAAAAAAGDAALPRGAEAARWLPAGEPVVAGGDGHRRGADDAGAAEPVVHGRLLREHVGLVHHRLAR